MPAPPAPPDRTGYGAPATGYSGYDPSTSAPAPSYGSGGGSGYGAPPLGYDPSGYDSGYSAPSSSYGNLKRSLNTANRVEKAALKDAEALYK